MKALRTIASELFGLFVEDGAFALAIAACIAVAAVLSVASVANGFSRAVELFVSLAIVLVASVLRAARTP